MAGLEKILQKIADDSSKQCADIVLKAEKEADAIRSQAKEKSKEDADKIIAKAKLQSETNVHRAYSTAKTIHKRAVLDEKVAMINEVLSEAASRLKSLTDNEYADAFLKLALRYTRKGEGIVLASSDDINRLPDDFETKLNTELAEKGAMLKLQESKQISDGFILVYGDIEQNCTFDSLIDAMRDELRDSVNHDLFS